MEKLNLDFETFRVECLNYTQNESYIKILFCQAYEETGGFSNRLSTEYFNLFSMKVPKIRQCDYSGEVNIAGSTYCVYSTPLQSIHDRLLLDVYNHMVPPTDDEDVLRYLADLQEHGYAEDKKYIEKIVYYFNLFFSSNGQNVINYYPPVDVSPHKFPWYLILLLPLVLVILPILRKKFKR